MGFNARYFIDLSTQIATPEEAERPVSWIRVVRPGDGSDYLAVIMPMRL